MRCRWSISAGVETQTVKDVAAGSIRSADDAAREGGFRFWH